MEKIKGLPSLLIIVAVVWLILRGLHVLIPTARPEVLTGPFELKSLSEVRAITGFSPRVPVYHPVSLGNEPDRIIAQREPEQRVSIVWRGERLLELIEQPMRGTFDLPVDAEAVPGMTGWWSWQRGGAIHLSGAKDDVHISVRTNLSREDAIRIASTLVPVDRMR